MNAIPRSWSLAIVGYVFGVILVPAAKAQVLDGACCRPNGFCAVGTQANCQAAGGEFVGVGTDCIDPAICEGACCAANGSCSILSPDGCGSDEFFGLGTACGDVDCVGACCDPDTGCSDLGTIGCVQGGGEFRGLGTRCALTECFGACCLPEKTCLETTTGRCAQFAGAYQGDGTACEVCPSFLSTGFSYQGQLRQHGAPYSGPANMRFSLWDQPIDGQQVAVPIAIDSVDIVNGLFHANLDFGEGAINGNARWLEVAVCTENCSAPNAYTTLDPRQPLTATPHALQTRGMFVNELGHVGVGTKNPANRLTVAGDADFSGNVGIGTQDPTTLLHLKQTINQNAIRMEAQRFVLESSTASDSTSTVTQIAGVGSVWVNPGSAGAIDGAFASTLLTTPTGDAESDELDFRNFGFNIPDGSVIRNVRVEINGSHAGGCSSCTGDLAGLDFSKQARLANGATFGDTRFRREQSVGGLFPGPLSDLWGLPLTPAIVNSSSFGVRVRVTMIPVTTVIDINNPPNFISPSDCPSCTATVVASIDGIIVTVDYGAPEQFTAEWTVGVGPSNGNFHISPSSDFSAPGLQVLSNGDVVIGDSPGPGGHDLTVYGGAYKPGGGSWGTTSDARLKHDIVPLQGTLDRLLTLRGYSYEFNDNEVKSGRALPGRQIGLIAQEVEQVFPDWIDYTKDGYRMVTERATTALMVESLRDLRREKDEGLAAQQRQIDALRQENAELSKRLKALETRRR